jgi:site-specific DNA-methyltransferase (cytosine-N4-specific)
MEQDRRRRLRNPQRTGRRYVGIDINAAYLDLSLRTRLANAAFDFEEGA